MQRADLQPLIHPSSNTGRLEFNPATKHGITQSRSPPTGPNRSERGLRVNAGAGRYGDRAHSAGTGLSRFKPLDFFWSLQMGTGESKAEVVFLPVLLGGGRPPPYRPLVRQLRSPQREGERRDHLRNRRPPDLHVPGDNEPHEHSASALKTSLNWERSINEPKHLQGDQSKCCSSSPGCFHQSRPIGGKGESRRSINYATQITIRPPHADWK